MPRVARQFPPVAAEGRPPVHADADGFGRQGPGRRQDRVEFPVHGDAGAAGLQRAGGALEDADVPPAPQEEVGREKAADGPADPRPWPV